MEELPLQMLQVGSGSDGREIAVRRRNGRAPGLFWLGGYRSDMAGSKAMALDGFGLTTTEGAGLGALTPALAELAAVGLTGFLATAVLAAGRHLADQGHGTIVNMSSVASSVKVPASSATW